MCPFYLFFDQISLFQNIPDIYLMKKAVFQSLPFHRLLHTENNRIPFFPHLFCSHASGKLYENATLWFAVNASVPTSRSSIWTSRVSLWLIDYLLNISIWYLCKKIPQFLYKFQRHSKFCQFFIQFFCCPHTSASISCPILSDNILSISRDFAHFINYSFENILLKIFSHWNSRMINHHIVNLVLP